MFVKGKAKSHVVNSEGNLHQKHLTLLTILLSFRNQQSHPVPTSPLWLNFSQRRTSPTALPNSTRSAAIVTKIRVQDRASLMFSQLQKDCSLSSNQADSRLSCRCLIERSKRHVAVARMEVQTVRIHSESESVESSTTPPSKSSNHSPVSASLANSRLTSSGVPS